MPNKSTPTAKPNKPYKDFPLYPHASKRWAKKIKGKTHFFGPWSDPQGALAKYDSQRDDLQAGRKPRESTGGLSLKDLANQYLTHKQARVATGERSPRTFADSYRSCELMLAHFGGGRLVEDLQPSDFEEYRKALSKGRGLVALGNEVTRARAVFNFAYKAELIEKPVRLGLSFAKPDKKAVAKAKNARPAKCFDNVEARKLLAAATPTMRAFILLALNGALGNSDVGLMEPRHIKGDWVTYPRSKTAAPRRFKLWPETQAAITAARNMESESAFLFLTKYGKCWCKESSANPVSAEFRKLCESLGLQRTGRGFYSLRHTFRTVADECNDRVAIDRVMGHSPLASDMGGHYREWIDDKRLVRVTDHVRAWLLPIPEAGEVAK